jgi:putative heme iron utilization protein
MDLHVETQEQTTSVRIEFEHLLEDAQDAHHTLIAMLKEARAKLKESPETSSAH